MRFKILRGSLEGKAQREQYLLAGSGRLWLLQMVLESITGWCASEDAGSKGDGL